MIEMLEKTDRKGSDGSFLWVCKCHCGKLFETNGSKARNGRIKSCGCLVGKASKHNLTGDKTYRIYKAMLSRCYNENTEEYKNYGGRGISVCDRWLEKMPNGYENFLSDMGEKPDGMSIERIDVNGDYEPDNCKWATTYEQSRNKRNNTTITLNGISKVQQDWAIQFDCHHSRVSYAVKYYGEDYEKVKEFCTRQKGVRVDNLTGQKNITWREDRQRYVVTLKIRGKTLVKHFKTLDEAIIFRDNSLTEQNKEVSND